MEGINTWWDEMPGERFWLGMTGRDGNSAVLAAPCGPGGNTPTWTLPLIKHVKDGDVVFHYDETQQAIVAWSTARGRVQSKRLAWSRRAQGDGHERTAPRLLPSWAIGLEQLTPLNSVVPVGEIARLQWDGFPALRAFEDRVGEPLYYPFAMGSASETHLLAGYVFKLPALFVEWFPSMARVAEQMARSAAAHARATRRSWSEPALAAASSDSRIVRASAQTSALVMR
jgi:hypothetical protein